MPTHAFSIPSCLARLARARLGRRLGGLAMGAALAGAPALPAAAADGFPNKPVRVVVGFAPGGGADVVARLVGAKMSNVLGQQVVVENRPGATGTIAADNVARSPADGYSMFLGSQSTMIVAPNMYPNLAFDPIKDFTPISQMVSMPLVLVVNPNLVKATTLAELTEELKHKGDGNTTYASSGQGGPQHIAGELYKKMIGMNITHVPYKGESAAIADVLGGHVPFMFANLPVAQPHVANGRLRALAITSLARSEKVPEIPTLHESGFKDFEVLTWYGVFAPAKTPEPVVAKLSESILRSLEDPDLRRSLDEQGLTIIGSTPAEFGRMLETEAPRWSKLIKEMGLRPE
ncbi:tripartite tricarboxylate transporter substrate binding protein [Orrella sp. JC864]|uniref:Bug family tripartite tricarboxylate transporter substrate binding protein n=1 Tax=Orrella sp. JC864 TaxID=3120298 RepID=UPI0012BCA116